jgi:hypothetical protein
MFSKIPSMINLKFIYLANRQNTSVTTRKKIEDQRMEIIHETRLRLCGFNNAEDKLGFLKRIKSYSETLKTLASLEYESKEDFKANPDRCHSQFSIGAVDIILRYHE